MSEKASQLEASLRERGVERARLAFVLGSGLGAFADRLTDAESIPYDEIEGMPRSSVPGHAGRLVLGRIGDVDVVCQQGRVHLYEGWSVEEVTRCARALASLGVHGIVLTNASGGLDADRPVPSLMRIEDHINGQGVSPASEDDVAWATPYDAELGAAIDRAAKEGSIELYRGVYAGLTGPTYETPAEIRMLRWMGADAVGMSTVAEAIAAHAAGARVSAVSCISNLGAGITGEKLNHEEVVEAGKEIADRFCSLLERAVPHMAAVLDT